MRFRPIGRFARTWLPWPSRCPSTDCSGFTLIEILIVVIILGVLSAIAIPQFAGSSDDAKQAALSANRTQLRKAVELYYHQHNGNYPGAKHHTTGAATTTAAAAESSFVKQLTFFTSRDGVASTVKDGTYKYGPYLKTGVPANPYNGLDSIKCDITTENISEAATDGTTGWKLFVRTGRLLANDFASASFETDIERDTDRKQAQLIQL